MLLLFEHLKRRLTFENFLSEKSLLYFLVKKSVGMDAVLKTKALTLTVANKGHYLWGINSTLEFHRKHFPYIMRKLLLKYQFSTNFTIRGLQLSSLR